jgi:hypothetical protein
VRVHGTVFAISEAELEQADRAEVAAWDQLEARLPFHGLAWEYVAASRP